MMSVAPHAKIQIHQLQQAVLHGIKELNKPRQGIMEMEVDVSLPSMSFQPFFAKQDICTIIHNNRISKKL
jgi:hypothetical protein